MRHFFRRRCRAGWGWGPLNSFPLFWGTKWGRKTRSKLTLFKNKELDLHKLAAITSLLSNVLLCETVNAQLLAPQVEIAPLPIDPTHPTQFDRAKLKLPSSGEPWSVSSLPKLVPFLKLWCVSDTLRCRCCPPPTSPPSSLSHEGAAPPLF